jgi:hypothetical protein
MLVKGSPQFETQDDFGRGDGISSIPQWHYSSSKFQQKTGMLNLDGFDLDPELQNILNRLRDISCQPSTTDSSNILMVLSPSDLHDLTCFVLHKLLRAPPVVSTDCHQAIQSECLRYAAAIYMFIIHGPTYFPHTVILQSLVQRLRYHLSLILSGPHGQLSVWLINAGMVGSLATSGSKWFLDQATTLRTALNFQSWEDIKLCLETVLWLETGTGTLFREAWEGIFASDTNTSPFKLALLPDG